MAYDTIKLKSPSMDYTVWEQVRQKCILRSGLDLETGSILYELHSGELQGSWDSRISVIPKNEDWLTDKNGTPRLSPCEPYVLVEASVHKAMHGHNVYGGPKVFKEACSFLVGLLEGLLEVHLPSSQEWTVHRVDYARVYRLPKAACKEWFDGVHLRAFPRRKKGTAKYDMALYFPGKTTTVKFYHKGSEFAVHDRSRLRGFFKNVFMLMYGKNDPNNLKRAEKKIEALQRLADGRIRVEVEIHSDKLQYDFDKNPKVSECTDAYFEALHHKECDRLLREGKQGMDKVRTTLAVLNRLETTYGSATGSRLHGFWSQLVQLGDDKVRERTKRTVYYRNRKALEEAGVSWTGTDVVIVANDSLCFDFVPLCTDRRLCNAPARNRPEFQQSWADMREAA